MLNSKYTLTPRQMDVALLASQGLTYNQIALKLQLAWRTVQKCLVELYKKLGIKGKKELPLVFKKYRLKVKVYKKYFH